MEEYFVHPKNVKAKLFADAVTDFESMPRDQVAYYKFITTVMKAMSDDTPPLTWTKVGESLAWALTKLFEKRKADERFTMREIEMLMTAAVYMCQGEAALYNGIGSSAISPWDIDGIVGAVLMKKQARSKTSIFALDEVSEG